MDNMSRRTFTTLAAASTFTGLAGCQTSPLPAMQPKSRQFSDDFIWGASTSALQTEGALKDDGRGVSIWDVFSQKGEHIRDGSTPEVATDSYHRYAEDAALLKGAGLSAYRFSISWPRIQPQGSGGVNPKGLDFYNRLVDAQLSAGVTPYATLYHWDLPQALQDSGGWINRDTANRFADYSDIVCDRLGDRVKSFIVLNEANVHTVFGHVVGNHAPGLKSGANIGPVTHHQNLAQGLAIQALRASRPDLKVGTAVALTPQRASGTPWAFWNKIAASRLSAIMNGALLDPLYKGTYPESMIGFVEPSVKQGDMAITQQAIDFLGVNYYAPNYVKVDINSDSHIAAGKPPAGVALDAFGRHIDPSGLTEVLEELRTKYGNPPILVTENGCSDPFSLDKSAILEDTFRIDYMRQHLEAILTANELGSQVMGYFVWSILDNWEWDLGFTSKFGLVAQAGPGGNRTTKASYHWYKSLVSSRLLPSAQIP